jgi:hypothetical protein
VDEAIANLKTEQANLKAAKAEFDAYVANQNAGMVDKAANITVQEANANAKVAEFKRLVDEVGAEAAVQEIANFDAIQSVDSSVATFMQAADATIGMLGSYIEELKNRKPVGGDVKRVNGKLTANVQYSDGTEKEIAAVREGGNLKIVANSEPGSEA